MNPIVEYQITSPALNDFSAPSFYLSEEWYGKKLSSPIGFRFILTRDALFFYAQQENYAAQINPNHQTSQFTEELWKFDVAEFFIYHPDSQLYYEFNLAPKGAWWMAAFCGKRQAQPGFNVPTELETYHEFSENSWKVSARIPLHFFSGIPVADFHPDVIEKTMLWATCAITESPNYLYATTTPHSGTPDFHTPELFKRIMLKA